MTVDGFTANLECDADLDAFRGQIMVLDGVADRYGTDSTGLPAAFEKSWPVLLDVCRRNEAMPRRTDFGTVTLRFPPEPRQRPAIAARAQGKRIDAGAQDALQERPAAH